MATVNQTCASILDKVTSSGLDFSIHQTPYSVHFSLRRKFSKSYNKIPLDYSSPVSSPENQDDRLRQELFCTRNEYEKLYNIYLVEHEAKRALEEEYSKLLEDVAKNEKVKGIKVDNKILTEKLENKSLEFKHLKNDFDNLNKDKNALSVALKAAKAENKEHLKEFEKKKYELEKKVAELNEFKKIKLAEEREEKLRKKKEVKRANQKLKKESKQQNLEKVLELENPKSSEELSKSDQPRNFGTEITKDKDSNFNENPEAEFEEKEIDLNDNFEAKDKEKDNNANDNPETQSISDEVVDDNHEDFKGSTLPPLKNLKEKDAFLKDMFAKVDKALENFWPS